MLQIPEIMLLKLQSHDVCKHEFLRRIPVQGYARVQQWDHNPRLQCVACMYDNAWRRIDVAIDKQEVITHGITTKYETYLLCGSCYTYSENHNVGYASGDTTLPSPQQHTANMRLIGYSNLIKIAISKIMPRVPRAMHNLSTCARCISHLRFPHEEICSGCDTAMRRISARIRSVILTWSAVHLLHECRMLVIGKYTDVIICTQVKWG